MQAGRHQKLRWTARLAALVALILAGLASIVGLPRAQTRQSDTWPTFLHDAGRSGASTDTRLSIDNVAQARPLWTFKTGGVIAASPTVAGDTVYVGSWDGFEYALDAATGIVRWKTLLGVSEVPQCIQSKMGISSAAAVVDGVLYVGGGDDYWYALDAQSGAVLWKLYLGDSASGAFYNWASPLIWQGSAYIGVASRGDCPLIQGRLLRVDLATHAVTAAFDVVPPDQLGGGIWTSPALDPRTRTIYVTTGNANGRDSEPFATVAIVALDAETLALKDKWRVPRDDQDSDPDWGTTPTLFEGADGTPLVSATNKNGTVYTFDRRHLAAGPLWQLRIADSGGCPRCGEGSISGGAFGGGALFRAGGNAKLGDRRVAGMVWALDPSSGKVLWQRPTTDPVLPSLAWVNGLLVVAEGPRVTVLDASNGTSLFSHQTPNEQYAAPSVANGVIYGGDLDGTVYALGVPAGIAAPPNDPTCPRDWRCLDVGGATPAGAHSVQGSEWAGGGAGIGTTDAFRLVSQWVTGDGQVLTRLAAPVAGGGAARAGVMMRQSYDAGAPFYALFATSPNTLVVQHRQAFDQPAAEHQVSVERLPAYLAIERQGDQLGAAWSEDGARFTLFPGTSTRLIMPDTALGDWR